MDKQLKIHFCNMKHIVRDLLNGERQYVDGQMKLAKKDAIFMHCLPASRGEEVTNEVMDGKQSVVWLGALNRIHIQKSIIQWCLK